jgi:hypothetical protein
MTTRAQGKVTSRDQEQIQHVMDEITALALFLKEKPLPADASPEVLHQYLGRMKQIQRNTSNGVSLVACVLAKKYLDNLLVMEPFDATKKDQSAPGLDIDQWTAASERERVIAEIKTTVPCGAKDLDAQRDLGAQQKATFEKDFQKLNKIPLAKHRFFFVTERSTYNLMRLDKYAGRIPGVKVVLLPDGDTFTA